MTDYHASIATKGSNIENLRAFIERELGKEFIDNESSAPLGLVIEINDYSEEFKYATDFLRERGLEEASPALREIEIAAFGIVIDLFFSKFGLVSYFADQLVDSIGLLASKELGIDTIVFLPQMEAPFRLYENGRLSKTFLSENKEYLSNRRWAPR